MQQVNEFAATHEDFDELSDYIAMFVSGKGQSLEDAYESAKQAHPVYVQKLIDSKAQEAVDKYIAEQEKEAEKARKAKSVNVRGRDTSKASTEPTGTMEDTMREVYRDIQNRSH